MRRFSVLMTAILIALAANLVPLGRPVAIGAFFAESIFAAQPSDELVRVFDSIAAVYDAAILIEQYRAETGELPKANGVRELLQARFGDDSLVALELAVDGWRTPLHIESAPGKGYLIVAAGSDRAFDRTNWSRRAEMNSAADDVVLRDGELVRSPVAWATAAAEDTGDLVQGMEQALEASRHRRTVVDLRSIAVDLITYELNENRMPAANTIGELAKQLGPETPRTDGWGHSFHVAIDTSTSSYVLVSPGPDGTLDPWSWSEPSRASDDIVLQNGKIIRNETPAPAGGGEKLAESIAGYRALRARFEAMRR